MLALTRCGGAVIKKHSFSFAICIGRTDLLDPLGPGLGLSFFFGLCGPIQLFYFLGISLPGPGPLGSLICLALSSPGPIRRSQLSTMTFRRNSIFQSAKSYLF